MRQSRQQYPTSSQPVNLIQTLIHNRNFHTERQIPDTTINDNSITMHFTLNQCVPKRLGQLLFIESIAASCSYLIQFSSINTAETRSTAPDSEYVLIDTNDTVREKIRELNDITELYTQKISQCDDDDEITLHAIRWNFYFLVQKEFHIDKSKLDETHAVFSSLQTPKSISTIINYETYTISESFVYYDSLTEKQKSILSRETISDPLTQKLRSDFSIIRRDPVAQSERKTTLHSESKQDQIPEINESFFRGHYAQRTQIGLDNSGIKVLNINDEKHVIPIAGAPISLHQKDKTRAAAYSASNLQQLIHLHLQARGQSETEYTADFTRRWNIQPVLLLVGLLSPIRGQSCLPASDSNDSVICKKLDRAIKEHNASSNIRIIRGNTPYNEAASFSPLEIDGVLNYMQSAVNSMATHEKSHQYQTRLDQIHTLIALPSLHQLITPTLTLLAEDMNIMLHHHCKSSKDRDRLAQEYQTAIRLLSTGSPLIKRALGYPRCDVIQELINTRVAYNSDPSRDSQERYNIVFSMLTRTVDLIRSLPLNNALLAFSGSGQYAARTSTAPFDLNQQTTCWRNITSFPVKPIGICITVTAILASAAYMNIKKNQNELHPTAIAVITAGALLMTGTAIYFRRDIASSCQGSLKKSSHSPLNNHKNKKFKASKKIMDGIFFCTFLASFIALDTICDKGCSNWLTQNDQDDWKKLLDSLTAAILLTGLSGVGLSLQADCKNTARERLATEAKPTEIVEEFFSPL